MAIGYSQSASTVGRSLAGRIVVVVGPPCAGKGTQCKRLAQQLGLLHLSTGDIFRYHVRECTELGLQAKPYFDSRSFLPDDIVIAFVRDRLAQPDVQRQGCLLDGFPRTADQAAALVRAVDIERVLLIDVADDDVLVQRAQHRRIDPQTGDIFHLEHCPPPSQIADRVTRRDNDGDEEAFRVRLEKYHANIGTVLPSFEGKLLKVDGILAQDGVFDCLTRGLTTPIAEAPVADDEWPDADLESQAPGVKPVLQVAPCVDVDGGAAECKVAVNVRVPDVRMRAPVDICCVIDISGSMRQAATPANAEAGDAQAAQDSGLTILDIVKHAVKAVMCILKDDDRMAIVAFDDTAELVFSLAPMSGRDQAMSALDRLQPRGRTNLWGGIHAGMEALREREQGAVARRKTLLVLTDGMPNIAPERGHIEELKLYKESHADFSFQMNTFGFGYNLDSELLANLAAEGHGTFAFIPDAVIVGTTFVNSVCNVLSTWTQNAQLHLMLQNGGEFKGPVVGEHPVAEASWGRVVNLGSLHLGQCRDIVVPMSIPAGTAPYLEAILVCSGCSGQNQASVEAAGRTATVDAVVAHLHSATVQVGFDAIRMANTNQIAAAQAAVEDLGKGIDEVLKQRSLMQGNDQADGRLSALQVDVEGRMAKAFNGKDRFNRWGKHYLRALLRAHQLQMCTNFMDPGLQVYGGAEFKALRDEGDAAFVSLPMPQPKKVVQPQSPTIAARRASAPAGNAKPATLPSPQANTYYAGAGGGCFGAKSTVSVVGSDDHNVCTAVTDVKPGDRVRVADGTAIVRCVVKIARDPARKLVALSPGLTVTPQHPVRWNGEWQRPATLGHATEDHEGYVYNFVLDRCHSLVVGSLECVTWGHGLEGPVVGHPYLGSDSVIADLSMNAAWNSGYVLVERFVRDALGQIVGLVSVPDIPADISTSIDSTAANLLTSEFVHSVPVILVH